ncbi:hypothetical protein B5F40_10375 [Gordonibacter sp. An230]|nr:hypothetical protein B5F40_10375 [Gordonibacter sp. An230]
MGGASGRVGSMPSFIMARKRTCSKRVLRSRICGVSIFIPAAMGKRVAEFDSMIGIRPARAKTLGTSRTKVFERAFAASLERLSMIGCRVDGGGADCGLLLRVRCCLSGLGWLEASS